MSKAKEIPDEMWERHRPQVLELFRGKRTLGGLQGLAKMMEKDHDFKATYVSPQPRFMGQG
jgi:hypothetical protein